MKRGIKVRIAAFLVLSAVGIVYVAGNYLGFVDKILGRGFTVHATLPSSGGLFEGSEVTYRGVKIGEVKAMDATRDGRAARPGARARNRAPAGLRDVRPQPVGGGGAVPRLRAAAAARDRTPSAGDTIEGNEASLPVDEGDLLDRAGPLRVLGRPGQPRDHRPRARADVQRHRRPAAEAARLRRQVHRRGRRPRGRDGRPARERHDRAAHPARRGREHPHLLPRPEPDHPQRCGAATRTCATRCRTPRPRCARSTRCCRTSSRPLPVLLGNAVSVDQVVVSHLAGLEQLLVTFPRTIGSGFTGTPNNNGGRVNLQFSNKVQPCTDGYKPNNEWRRGDELSDAPIFPAAVRQPGAVQHARHEVRPRWPAATRVRPDASTARRTTRAPDWSRGQWTRRATPYDSSTRGTCRCWEEIRGSGCWWGR